MSQPCLICLLDATAERHVACTRSLFGTDELPVIDVEVARLHTLGLAMVGNTSLSGIQRKISLGLSADRQTLQVGIGRQRFILKPRSDVLPHLPANEHVTMRIAAAVGLEIPPCGLVRLRDGSLAYVTARFDRPPHGSKLPVEDFCQLSQRPQKHKFDASAEDAVEILRTYASEPLVELLKLFRQFAFAWWTGNGDMHLKNLAMLTDRGVHRLSPAYDLLCTRLVIAGDRLALPIRGRRDALTPPVWKYFAKVCEIPWPAAERVLRGLVSKLDVARQLIARSMLPDDLKADYSELLGDRAATLLSQRSQD